MAFHCRTQQGLTDGELLAEIEKARGDIASSKAALAHRKPTTPHAESATETGSTKRRGQHHDTRIERTTPIESGASDESIESPDGALFEASSNEDSGETTVYTTPYRQSDSETNPLSYPRRIAPLRSKRQKKTTANVQIKNTQPCPSADEARRRASHKSGSIRITGVNGSIKGPSGDEDAMQSPITCPAAMIFLRVVFEKPLNCTWKAFTWLWWLFIWPLMFLVMILFIVQIIALVYTARSNTFFVAFCEQKLPHLRHWGCSDYDKLSNMKSGNIEDIHEPFAEMFTISNISFTLPYWLSKWEMNIRILRASLPTSELSKEDQLTLRAEFTEYIALSYDVLDAAQFHENHVTGTIKRLISGSRALTIRFEYAGLLQPLAMGTAAKDGILTIGMEWLYTRNLVFLPIGIEPFREGWSSTGTNAISQMETFIRTVGSRIEQDISETNALQEKLNALRDVSSRIHGTVQILMSVTNKKAAIIEVRPVWEWLLYKLGKSNLDDYFVKQQIDRLGSMAPVFGHASQYLAQKLLHLGAVQNGLNDLIERLHLESRVGGDASSWFTGQIRAMDEEVKEVEQSWLIWSEQRKEFQKQLLGH